MTEIEKIAYAKTFIDKLANGINPLNDAPVAECDIVNNVRLSRCFFYVSDILRQVIDNGGVTSVKRSKQPKKAFQLTEQEHNKLRTSENAVPVSEIANRLNAIIDCETMKRISAATINNWLLKAELLEINTMPDGKNRKIPTADGNKLGIFSEERTGQYGKYVIVLFNSRAQQFIYDNIESIVEAKEELDDPLSEFHGRPWTQDHDSILVDLFEKNVAVSEMAFELKRTEGGIRARLQKLGLIENKSDI